MALGNKEIMARNIKAQLEKKGINQTELCNILGFKPMTVSDWLNAKTYPRIDKIEMMAAFFGITKSELVEAQDADDKEASPSYALTPDESSLIDDYRTLNEVGKQKVREQIHDLKEIPRYTEVQILGHMASYNEDVPAHLLPNAAHERTDVEVTQEARDADEALLAEMRKKKN